MNPVSFRNETAGGIAYRTNFSQKNETTGSVGEKEPTIEPEIKFQELETDTVNFRGQKTESEKKTSLLGMLAYTGFTAAALITALGCAKKYNWIDKLGEGKFKDYVCKYAVNPSYDACKYLKTNASNVYNKIKSRFK